MAKRPDISGEDFQADWREAVARMFVNHPGLKSRDGREFFDQGPEVSVWRTGLIEFATAFLESADTITADTSADALEWYRGMLESLRHAVTGQFPSYDASDDAATLLADINLKLADVERRYKVRHLVERAADAKADGPQVDIDTLELIHRHHDGWISLCRQANDGHQDLAGVRANKLREYLPKLLPWLMTDSFFSINASYRAKSTRSPVTGLLMPDRREISLRYLTACYLDLDTYNADPPLDWPDNYTAILRAVEANVIPAPSIVFRSGRGLYTIWLLTQDRTGALQSAHPWEISLYKQVNQELGRRLSEFEPRLCVDSIHDAARLLRVPGTINSKSTEPVIADVLVTKRGLMPSYPLVELAETVNVQRVLPQDFYRVTGGRAIQDRGSCPARRNGAVAVSERRAHDILTICQHRRGFDHGRRRRSLSYLAEFARWAGWTLSRTEQMVLSLARICRPPYPSEANDTPPQDIVRQAFTERLRKRHVNDKLAKFFRVTPEMAAELNLQSTMPQAERDRRAAERIPRASAQTSRRARIRELVLKHPGNYPTGNALARTLESDGLGAHRATVYRDLNAVLADLRAKTAKSVA